MMKRLRRTHIFDRDEVASESLNPRNYRAEVRRVHEPRVHHERVEIWKRVRMRFKKRARHELAHVSQSSAPAPRIRVAQLNSTNDRYTTRKHQFRLWSGFNGTGAVSGIRLNYLVVVDHRAE